MAFLNRSQIVLQSSWLLQHLLSLQMMPGEAELQNNLRIALKQTNKQNKTLQHYENICKTEVNPS